MAAIAVPAELTVVHIVPAMAISTYTRHIEPLRGITIVTGQAINPLVCTIQPVIRLFVVIELPQ